MTAAAATTAVATAVTTTIPEEETAYLLSKTGLELERLRKQHDWIVRCLDGNVIFAPVDLQKHQLKVLDVGCADGTLLRHLQGQVSPSAKLVGVDIMSSFLPDSPQGNISFAVADIGESPAPERTAVFDLTHVRFLLPWALTAGADKVIQNLADTLAPGGWLQVTEWELPEQPQQCTAWNDMITLMSLIFNKTGVGADYASHLAPAFERAGLKNVTVQKVHLPAGRKLRDDAAALDSLVHWKITTPTILKAIHDLGIEVDPAKTNQLEERFVRDMMEEGAVFTSYIIYGQKA